MAIIERPINVISVVVADQNQWFLKIQNPVKRAMDAVFTYIKRQN